MAKIQFHTPMFTTKNCAIHFYRNPKIKKIYLA